GLDGAIADSFQINSPGDRPPFPIAIPGTTRFLYNLVNDGVMRFVIVERDGTELSSISTQRGVVAGASAAKDAIWLYLRPAAVDNASIVRVPFDQATMKLASHGDTLYTGNTSSLSVTSDGGTVVY